MPRRFALFSVLAIITLNSAAYGQTPNLDVRGQCAEDEKKFCTDVQPGGGRIVKCLRDNEDKLSQGCKDARAAMRRRIERKNAPPSGDN